MPNEILQVRTTFLLIFSPVCCLLRVKMDSCLLRSIRGPSPSAHWFSGPVFATLQVWPMPGPWKEGSMTKRRRCHLCFASGGTIFSLTALQACGLCCLGQKQQLGPSLHCGHRKLHKGFTYGKHLGLCQSRLWGQVGCSRQLCSQLPDCRERLSPLSTRCLQ